MIALKIIAAVIVLQILGLLFFYGACHKPTPEMTDEDKREAV